MQVNCRMAADSADRLKALAESAGLPIGAFIEKVLDCYQSDSKVLAGSDGWQSVADDLSNRLLALETRLEALEAVRGVKGGAVGKEAHNAAVEPVDVVIETVDAEPGIEQSAVQKADMPTCKPADAVVIIQDTEKFKAAVVAAYKSGITKGADILRHVTAQGYRNSEGNPYYRSGVENTLKRAGLKD